MIDYALVDADQHYYEPDDCFSRHLEHKYLSRGVEVRHDRADGLGRVYLEGVDDINEGYDALMQGEVTRNVITFDDAAAQ